MVLVVLLQNQLLLVGWPFTTLHSAREDRTIRCRPYMRKQDLCPWETTEGGTPLLHRPPPKVVQICGRQGSIRSGGGP